MHQNSNIFIHKNALENVICKTWVILSGGRGRGRGGVGGGGVLLANPASSFDM